MEIYTDKEKHKGIIVVDAYEMHLLASAEWWAMTHWYDRASKREDIGLADIDKSIGDSHQKLGELLAKAEEDIKEDTEINKID